MRSESRQARQAEIEEAAYQLLETKGYSGTTIQALAKLAKVSNETLYRWYGGKTELFKALIDRNTDVVRDALAAQAEDPSLRGLEALRALGVVLYGMILGPRAIALNRAAAADPEGGLGTAIARGGRQVVGPMIAELILRAVDDGDLPGGNARERAEMFIALLVGDKQIRRAIGVMAPPTEEEARDNAARAVALLCQCAGDAATAPLDLSGQTP